MRSLTISLLLLLLAVAIMLSASLFLRQSCEQLLSALGASEAEPALPDAQVLLDALACWERRAPLLSLVAPRSSIRRVREQLLTLQSCAHEQPEVMAKMTLAQLIDTVKQLKKDTLSLPIG
jgi:hypothetical protein